MRHIALFLLALSALALLSGCGGRKGVRVTEGDQQIGAAPIGSLFVTDQATVVHVNEFDRLATLRNARKFGTGSFLETRDADGNKTATLKTRENRETGLGTADIVEGMPQINNRATQVSTAQSARLEKIYRDLDEE